MNYQERENFKNAKKCHICEDPLVKPQFLDSRKTFNIYTGKYAGQSHRECFFEEQNLVIPVENEFGKVVDKIEFQMWSFLNEKDKHKIDETDEWIKKTQQDCLFCGESLLRKNFRDAVKDHCHISGKFRGAAHSDCNKKLKIKPKTIPIPVVFHNLKGYDSYLLMQAISETEGGAMKCIANNMEKYISFSLGNLVFIDIFGFLSWSLESVVKARPKEEFKITKKLFPKNQRN